MNWNFAISVGTNQRTGEIMAVYFQVREGKATEVKEFADGAAFANYSRKGELLGVELLAPCRFSVLDKITTDKTIRRFIRGGMPADLVAS